MAGLFVEGLTKETFIPVCSELDWLRAERSAGA